MKLWKYCVPVMFLCAAFLAGCGGKEPDAAGASRAEVQPGSSGDAASSGAGASGTQTGASGAQLGALGTGVSSGEAPSGGTASPVDAAEQMDIVSQMTQVMEITFDNRIFYEEDHTNYGNVLDVQFYQGEPAVIWRKDWSGMSQWHILENGEAEETTVFPIGGGIYLSRADGSSELLIAGEVVDEVLPDLPGRYQWYLDKDGGCYCLSEYPDEDGRGEILKLDTQTGAVLYRTKLPAGWGPEKICQAPDGAAYLVLASPFYYRDGRQAYAEEEKKITKLTAFDSETGILSGQDVLAIKAGQMGSLQVSFGEGDDGIYMYNPYNGYWKVSLEEGSTQSISNFAGLYDVTYTGGSLTDFMMFSGTTWSGSNSFPGAGGVNHWYKEDFHVNEDGTIDALAYMVKTEEQEVGETTNAELNSYLEGVREANNKRIPGANICTVAMETLSWAGSGRIPVTVRGVTFSNWMKAQAAQFNRMNGTYRVVLEDVLSGGAGDEEDYARQTFVELSAGKGPDILCGDLMGDYVRGLMDKRALLELGAMMEASGIREEDYLPVAFSGWRDAEGGIYGVNPSVNPIGYQIRKEVLSGGGGTDIRGLMDALSDWEGDGVYFGRYDAGHLLPLFLEGSEDLWGMVVWEAGTCDFGGELFAQILENAERYGCDGRHNYQSLARARKYTSIYRYDSLAELEAAGMAVSGVLFDDGCHGAVDSRSTLAVNGASEKREGAWEFLCWLLGREAQAELEGTFPLNREALSEWMERELEQVAGGGTQYVGDLYVDYGEMVEIEKTYTKADMTQERIAEYLAQLEDVRVLPWRTEPILDIIYEEAEGYFSGGRSMEDVVRVIQNRVQLYLDE